MKHLQESDVGYWTHWWTATRAGLALLVHAWLPNVLPDYASRLICPREHPSTGCGNKDME